jgi:hypothetical protein
MSLNFVLSRLLNGLDVMHSEAEAWNALRKNMLPLHPVRIENAAGAGTPDVNYVGGWIEMKYAERWPVRGGALKLPHYTAQQRGFAMKRIAAGGKCFVMLHIGETGEWLLFAGNVAALHLGKLPQFELKDKTLCVWKTTPKLKELQKWL